MSSRDIIRLVPEKTINLILKIDAPVMSTNTARFVQENQVSYDLAINTWMIALKQYAPYSWATVLSRITHVGLAATVNCFNSEAVKFLQGSIDSVDDALVRALYAEIRMSYSIQTFSHPMYETCDTPEGVFLFLLRYLKRFTPMGSDVLNKRAISDFWNNQKRLKFVQREGYNGFILDLVRAEVPRALIEARCQLFRNILVSDIEFSPGVCYSSEGKKCGTLASKYAVAEQEIGYADLDTQRSIVWSVYPWQDRPRYAYLTSVPKTFKSARTIAPEECIRQAVAHRMFTLTSFLMPEGIYLHSQEENQKAAKLGSVSGSLATIDLSHASDDVTLLLVSEVYHQYPEYLSYLSKIRPTYLISDGQSRLLHSFATMGNAMTFVLESEIFYLITKAAVHFAQRHGCECHDNIWVYGDDIICHTNAYPYVVAFLEKLGFAVNSDKSFSSGSFRESCGKDYLNGKDVSSPYFPRRPLSDLQSWFRDGRDSRLFTVAESVIALQHRLMEVCPPAAQFVEFYLRDSVSGGRLGIQTVGTKSTDLWGYDHIPSAYRSQWAYVPRFTTRKNPYILVKGWWTYSPVRRTFDRVKMPDGTYRLSCYYRPVVTVETAPINDAVLYHQYLREGPYYASLLDRRLGISTSRRQIPTGSPTSCWRMVEE